MSKMSKEEIQAHEDIIWGRQKRASEVNIPGAEDMEYQAKCDARDELIDRAFED